MTAIYATDPKTKESVTLSELAKRHQLSVSTLSRRHAEGKRGDELVEPFDIRRYNAEQRARAQAAAERKEAVLAANSRGLMRPLNHIAEVSNMVGGDL